MVKAINAIIFNKSKEVLVVKKKNVWILPGGKPKEGENPLETLSREVKEELSGTEICNTKPYLSFGGEITPHSKKPLRVEVYFADLVSSLGNPSAEILDARYVPLSAKLNFSDITWNILKYLRKEGYLRL